MSYNTSFGGFISSLTNHVNITNILKIQFVKGSLFYAFCNFYLKIVIKKNVKNQAKQIKNNDLTCDKTKKNRQADVIDNNQCLDTSQSPLNWTVIISIDNFSKNLKILFRSAMPWLPTSSMDIVGGYNIFCVSLVLLLYLSLFTIAFYLL